MIMGATSSAANSSTGDYELMEAGQKPGRCIAVIELGTHPNTHALAKPGATKKEVILIFEVSELMEDGRPFTVNLKVTNSLGDKAHLYRHLNSWRGTKFTKEELAAFNLGKLLDVPALLNITKTEAANGKTYNNIETITPLPPAMKAGLIDRINHLVDFGICDLATPEVGEHIWPWIRKVIEESEEGIVWIKEGGKFPEFVALQAPGKNPETGTSEAGAETGGPVEPSDIPF